MNITEKKNEISERFFGSLELPQTAQELWDDLNDLKNNLGWDLTYSDGSEIEFSDIELMY